MATGDDVLLVPSEAAGDEAPVSWTWPLWDRAWAIVAWFLPVRREATAAERGAVREAEASTKALAIANAEIERLKVSASMDAIRIEQLVSIVAYHEARLKAAADIEAIKATGGRS